MINQAEFRILIIDDNPEIHRDFIKILTTSPHDEFNKLSAEIFGEQPEEILLPDFEISTASQGQEGVAKIKEALANQHPYALAFVDIRMPPGWDGIETIKHIWELDKDIQVVICTAYTDYSWEETVSHLGKTDNLLILKKPFDNISVRQLACALTKKWQLIQEARKYTNNLKQQVENKTLSLQQSLSLVKATLESSSDGILVINNTGDIIDFNKKLLDMWRLPRNILQDRKGAAIFDQVKSQLINAKEFFDRVRYLQDKIDEISIETLQFKDGRVFECYSQPQKLENKTIGRVYDFRDITKRAKLEKDLQYQASHDSLTGLPNRVMLLDKMRSSLQTAQENHGTVALLFFDLDRFKLVNDSLSHAIGDELLKMAANRLQSITPEQDTLARLGGDEFVIILNNVANTEEIVSRAIELLGIFQLPFNVSNREVTITASVGISLYPNDGVTPDVLLRNADAAMYRAKEMGGNNFQFYTAELNIKNLAKLDQEMQLRRAIANKEFFLVYQPQLDLSDEKLVAVEALIRWQDPDRGVILPMDFIPLAEETGLILPIGEWVIRMACAQNKAWQDAGLPPIRVAVNVTAHQFKQQNIVAMISSILQETGLHPRYLELELTENVIINNKEIIQAVTDLKELGVSVALDDFGTGYSSLSYLKKIPLDRLKIDSSFIQHIQLEGDDEAIIRAVIAMAKNLELEVLAEGVETRAQSKFLKAQHCGEVQGHYYSKPLSINELEGVLKNPANIKKILKII